MQISRRSLFSGIAAVILSPAVIRVARLMPIRVQPRLIAFDEIPPSLLVPAFYAEVTPEIIREYFVHSYKQLQRLHLVDDSELLASSLEVYRG